jgi:hypothetical protein
MGNGRPKVRKLKSRIEYRQHENNDHFDAMMVRSFYNNVNPQRTQEVMDSRMIQEDHGAIANLSGTPINRTFMANRFMQSLGKNDERSDV